MNILLLALFIVINIEWHFHEIYIKFQKYDLIFSILVLFILGFCVLKNKMKLLFTKIQMLLLSVLMAIFFFYWTFDVKGYFKGYDTYYGSMILFVGFIFSFVVIEYFKYFIDTNGFENNKFLYLLKNNKYIISLFQVFMVVWANRIMMWYQSPRAFYLTIFFIVLFTLPEKISPYRILTMVFSKIKYAGNNENVDLNEKYTWNYFCNMILSAIISYAAMFVIAIRGHRDVISAPFILSFACLFGIYNYFKTSGEGEKYYLYDWKVHKEYLKKNIFINTAIILVSSLTVIIPILILGPIENYYANVGDFEFACSDFLIQLIVYSGIAILIYYLFCLFLCGKSFKTVASFVFSIGIVTYIQIMFMNTKLSMSNGDEFDISSLGAYPIINIIIWSILLVLICIILILIKDKWKELILFIGGGLCIIQAVAAISLPLTTYTGDKSVSYWLVSNDEFKLSKEENIVVFVLDTLGNVQFDQAREEYDDIDKVFKDFTYYNNADCTYSWTDRSLTHMLTGQDVDFSLRNREEWCQKAWSQDSVKKFYDILHNDGYAVNFYIAQTTPFGDGSNLKGKVDNLKEYDRIPDHRKIAYKMFRYSLYKALPYVWKGRFQEVTDNFFGLTEIVFDENDTDTSVGLIKFYERLSDGLSINPDRDKEIKIIHLNGTHTPLNVSKDFEECEEDVSRYEVVYANVELIQMYMDEMKRLGVYDNSTIIVTADHGTYYYVTDPQPILLVKEKNTNMPEMKISTAPVSHKDFMASILDFIGEDYTEYGRAYKDIQENENRERTCGYIYEDKETRFYIYTGDRDDLISKFPENPDYEKSF